MSARTTTQKGLGWRHQQERERLLRAHRDGARCWWCGERMYREAERNVDGAVLEADHEQARSQGGTHAGRLLHGVCNKQRGDGSRDDQRPALLRQSGGCESNVLAWAAP